MKVKCITKYHDTQLKKMINVGDELEVADARGAILINARVVEALTTPEVATKPAPKKRTKKNVEVE